MIKAAEVRAQISQIQKFDQAVHAFQLTYNAIPGDISPDAATQFGFVAGIGNGDGLIEGCDAGCIVNANPPACQGGQGETEVFFNHLSSANLIQGYFKGRGTSTPITSLNRDSYYPQAKIGKGYVTVGCVGTINYYMITSLDSIFNAAYSVTPILSPQESYAIDSKMDDGMPNSGWVQAKGNSASSATMFTDSPPWSTANPNAAVSGDCVTGGASASDTANIYAMIGPVGTTPACMLRFQFQ